MQPALALQDDARRWHLTVAAARSYQQFTVPVLLRPWAAKLVQTANPSRNCCVLDLACGTGVAARIAAKTLGPGGKVVGIDRSAPMLSVARSLEPVQGAPVRWRLGDAEALHLPNDSFDVVLCHQGFQFFPDRLKAAVEIARVLRPGGRLALTVWCGPDQNPLPAALIGALQNRGYPALSSAFAAALLGAESARAYHADYASRISRCCRRRAAGVGLRTQRQSVPLRFPS
jgi:ubiquinone/menaquinone biosynthesis C-methylase UbiE